MMTPLILPCLCPTPGHNSPPISGEGLGESRLVLGELGGGSLCDLVHKFADNALFGCSSISRTYPHQSVLHLQIVTQPHFYWCLFFERYGQEHQSV